MEEPKVNSLVFMEEHYKIWNFLGLNLKNKTWINWIWDIVLSFFVTFFFPFHLAVGVMLMRDAKLIFFNLSATVASISSCLKQCIFRFQFQRMNEINDLFRELDFKVKYPEDRKFVRQDIYKSTRLIFRGFLTFYRCVPVIAWCVYLLTKTQNLIYPAWFPFDVSASTFNHVAALVYQTIATVLTIEQNIVNDSYPPLALCILSGHVQLLGNRIARIGNEESKSEEQHYKELVDCIKDFLRLKRIVQQIQTTISWTILVKSVTNGLALCFALIFLVFYAENVIEYGYGGLSLVALYFELYPTCYYGSIVEVRFHNLTYEMFSCNWHERNVAFRRSLTIFAEISLREVTLFAENMVRVHLDTYFATLRMSYSLVCLVLNMK